MAPTTDIDKRATGKQLAYLKSLATQTGQTFAWPQTRGQASREIRRLKALTATHDLPNDFDLDAEQAARQANDGIAIQAFEIEGYGSNCRWSRA
jgi:DUF3072 family protein